MTSEIPKAVRSGIINICGLEIHVHILDDGTSVIEEGDFHKILDAIENGAFIQTWDDTMLLESGIEKNERIS